MLCEYPGQWYHRVAGTLPAGLIVDLSRVLRSAIRKTV
jgi:hypothetical protein